MGYRSPCQKSAVRELLASTITTCGCQSKKLWVSYGLRAFNPPKEFLGPSVTKLKTELKISSQDLPAPGAKKFKSVAPQYPEVD